MVPNANVYLSTFEINKVYVLLMLHVMTTASTLMDDVSAFLVTKKSMGNV